MKQTSDETNQRLNKPEMKQTRDETNQR